MIALLSAWMLQAPPLQLMSCGTRNNGSVALVMGGLESGLQALAVDVSLASLLGEDVYNFGELLLHPIVSGKVMQTGAPTGCCTQGFLSNGAELT